MRLSGGEAIRDHRSPGRERRGSGTPRDGDNRHPTTPGSSLHRRLVARLEGLRLGGRKGVSRSREDQHQAVMWDPSRAPRLAHHRSTALCWWRPRQAAAPALDGEGGGHVNTREVVDSLAGRPTAYRRDLQSSSASRRSTTACAQRCCTSWHSSAARAQETAAFCRTAAPLGTAAVACVLSRP